MARRIVQIAVASPAGWNGLNGEEYHFDMTPQIFALDEDGRAWAFVEGRSKKWVELPEIPPRAGVQIPPPPVPEIPPRTG